MDKLVNIDNQRTVKGKAIADPLTDNRIERSGSDPRIESPEIEVIYPSIPEERARFAETPAETEPEEAPTCDCKKQKTDWLTALQENGTPFLLIALVLLVLGYALGRRQG